MSLSPVSNSCTVDPRDTALDTIGIAQTPAHTRPGVDVSAGYPKGDGSFASSVAGTTPQAGDLHLSLMSNDSYTTIDPVTGRTGTASEAELNGVNWNRLHPPADPQADHLLDADGNRIPIDPSMLSDPESGFDAAIYQNDQGQYVIAYRGTDSWVGENGASDSPANAGQSLGLETRAYSKAVKLAELAIQTFGEGNVVTTGQSLGGGLASAAAVATDIPGVTFNSSGLSNNTLRSFDLNPNAAREQIAESGQVRRYVVDGEQLTLGQQDIPVIPLPFVGPVSPPNAVGTELRIDPPAGTPWSELHGGGGKNPSYVEALRENVARAPVDPLAGSDARLALDTLQNYGELSFNQIGNAVQLGMDAANSVSGAYRDTANAIGDVVATDIADGRYVQGGVRVAGDVVDGVVGAAGGLADNALDYAGGAVENVANFGGAALRDIGDWTRLDAPFDAVANVLEEGGHYANRGLDTAGDAVNWSADKLGDGAEWVIDRGGEGLQWGTDRVVDGAKATADAAVWTGGKVVEGAEWVGDRVVDGAKATADAAVWTGGKVVEGAEWVGDRVIDGANAVVDGARWTGERVADGAAWVAEKANPFNWFK